MGAAETDASAQARPISSGSGPALSTPVPAKAALSPPAHIPIYSEGWIPGIQTDAHQVNTLTHPSLLMSITITDQIEWLLSAEELPLCLSPRKAESILGF